MEFSISLRAHWEYSAQLMSWTRLWLGITLECLLGYLASSEECLECQQGLLIVPIGVLEEFAAPARLQPRLRRQHAHQVTLDRIERRRLALATASSAEIDELIGYAKVVSFIGPGQQKGAHIMPQHVGRAVLLEAASYGNAQHPGLDQRQIQSHR